MNPQESIAHYRIISKLGEGGMGEVYRATDTKLNRDVAIKVLPDAFAQDAERMARFEREAQVLASLNHPNIAAIYGIEQGAMVMELVEGERPRAGPLPLDDGACLCAADRRRAGSGAREGHHPSRPEAGEHQGHAGRHRQGAGLRAGEGGREGRRGVASQANPTSRRRSRWR